MRKAQVTAMLIGSTLLVVPAIANASDPFGIVVSPRAVEFYPSEAAATEVVIKGNFSFNKGGTAPSYDYSAPVCGYMYFKCPAGKEAECRMQWSEIKSSIDNCRGFGTYSKAPTSTVRASGTALGTPDVYDLGMGTMNVGGIGNCPTMKTTKCDVTIPGGGDAGAIDAGSPVDAGKADTGSTTSDTGVGPTDSGSVTPPADTGSVTPPADTGSVTPPADTGSVTPPVDAGGTPPAAGTDDGGGCSVSTVGTAAPFGAVVLALIAVGLVRRRRS